MNKFKMSDYRIIYNDELYHHGVKGMKWGVRKDRGSLSGGGSKWNSNYSETQRTRDRAIYGRGGVRRINKSMNNGQTVSGARSIEAARINSARRKAQVAGQAGATVGQIGGAVAGLVLSKYAKQKISDESMQMAVTPIISYGASTVAKQLGRYGAQDMTMMLYGYSPSKYRNAKSSLAKGAFETDTVYVKDGTRLKAALAIPNRREQQLNAEAAARTAKKTADDNRYSRLSDHMATQKQLFEKMDAARSSGNKEQQKYYEELLRESLRNTARGNY